MVNVKQGSCKYKLLKSIGLDSARESNPGLLTLRVDIIITLCYVLDYVDI